MGGCREMSFVVVALALLSRTDSVKFTIFRNLKDAVVLPENLWSNVEITGLCSDDSGENVDVNVNISSKIASNFTSINIFFANNVHNILEVDLGKTVKGTFYSTPYRAKKDMESSETEKTNVEGFVQISGGFPRNWLPVNCSKLSASILLHDGTYMNYYGIKNFEISIPDLMVVEEYKRLDCDF